MPEKENAALAPICYDGWNFVKQHGKQNSCDLDWMLMYL
jgi:hypothetical protein